MEDGQAVVADSASETPAAPSAAAASTDVTHGDQTEQAQPTDQTEGESTEGAESEELDDQSFEEQIKDLSEEEKKTKSQERRERRQKREADRIERERREAVEAYQREQEAKAAADKAEAEAKAASEAFFAEFGALVGTPEVRSALDAEISTLIDEVERLKPYAEGTDLEVLEQKQTLLQKKRADRAELNRNKETYDKIDAFQFRMAQREWAAGAATLPAEHQQRYLSATSIPELLKVHEDGIVAREAAKHKATLDATVAEWSGKLAKEEAAHAATRTGAPGAGPSPNGSNGTSATVLYTRERLRQLMQTPEGMAEYRRNRAEIERQEAAGLIR